jgi:hypothetical protein
MKYRKLSELTKLDNNPRVIRDARFKSLCESIRTNREYFEARPLILSNRTGALVILAGNQRYEAARHLKLREVPTHLIEGLTAEKEREIIIRDNVENGEFDFGILASEWASEPLVDWGVSVPEPKAVGESVELREVDVSDVQDRFWLSVVGPLPEQIRALEHLVKALESLPGVDVQVGTTKTEGGLDHAWTA